MDINKAKYDLALIYARTRFEAYIKDSTEVNSPRDIRKLFNFFKDACCEFTTYNDEKFEI